MYDYAAVVDSRTINVVFIIFCTGLHHFMELVNVQFLTPGNPLHLGN